MSETTETKKELTLTRVFDAPQDRVFKAWIDPKLLAQWWGPKGFTNPVCELDARPGGAISVQMRAPDGQIYPMGGAFHEIIPPEKLVFTTTAHLDDSGKPMFEVWNTVTFSEKDGKTKLSLHAVVKTSLAEIPPVGLRALEGMNEGWSQSLVKLGEFLSTLSP